MRSSPHGLSARAQRRPPTLSRMQRARRKWPPGGDLTPWGEIFFAYDPAFEKVSDYSELPLERRSDLDREEIAETYRYLAEVP